MKITKTPKQVAGIQYNRAAANIGCNVCPCCGETKDCLDYIIEGTLNGGIFSGLHRTWVTGFIRTKHMRQDLYKCETCGAEWESEPYECK